MNETPLDIGLTVTLKDGTPFRMYTPFPKQRVFHENPTTNVLAIGNRSGGKSMMLRMDAHMRALSVPNSNLILIRKTYKQLETSHVYFQGLPWSSLKQEMELLGGDFHATKYICYYPNGSRLFLSYVGHENDALNLLSAEFIAAYFDELSTIPWEFFLKLKASVRTRPGTGLKAVVRAATNPLGESTPDILKYFVDKEIDYTEEPDYLPTEWDHIEIGMDDNPHIDAVSYKKSLAGANLPEHIKQAWIYGLYFDEEAIFTFIPFKESGPWHVTNDVDISELVNRGTIYRCYDHGYNPDPAYCAWIAHLGNRYIVFHEKQWNKTVIADIAKDIKNIDSELGVTRIVSTFADPTIDVHTGHDVRTMKDVFEQNGIPMECSINNREQFASAIHTALAEEVEIGNEKGSIKVPRLQIYAKGCPYLVKSLPMMRYDDKRPLAMANHKHDHPSIALAYFLISHSAGNFTPYSERKIPRWMLPKRSSNFILGQDSVRRKIN